MSKICAYVRISTIKQSTNTSLEYQSEKIRDYCKLHDLDLCDIYSEVDSGGNDNRIVFNQLKDYISEGKIDNLLIFKLDRLSRSMLGGLQFIQFCKDNNCRVICISENLDTSDPKSELMFNILLSIATEEKRMINERCSNGRSMKWSKNELPYSKISFGYKRNKNKSIVPTSDSEIVKYIFKKWNQLLKNMHITKTKRTQRLLKLLKQRGFKYYGSDFKSYHIKQILNNKFYCGIMSWKGEEKESPYPSIISKRLFNQIR